MRPVSRRYSASIGLAKYVVRVEWSNDLGVTWTPCTYVSGFPGADATSQVRWSITDLVVTGVDVGRDALSPFGTLIRLWSGMEFSDDDVEWVPLGVYRAKTVNRTGAMRNGDRLVTASGQSRESVVIADRFVKARQFKAQDGVYLIERLIKESIPTASFRSMVSADEYPMTPKIIEERDRWAVIDGDDGEKSIARSLGATVFCDGDGVFVLGSPPTLEDPPVWEVDSGPNGAIVEPAESLSDEGVFNAVSARGATEETNAAGKPVPPVGPVLVADSDPSSATFVDGPFGRVTRFYSSPLLKTSPQCAKAASTMLAKNLGLRQNVTLSAAPNFALEVGDVIRVRMPDGTMESHVIDSIAYPLGGGVMEIGTRSTATRFAGQPDAAPEDDEDVDEGMGESYDG